MHLYCFVLGLRSISVFHWLCRNGTLSTWRIKLCSMGASWRRNWKLLWVSMGKSNGQRCIAQLHEHIEQEEEGKEDAPVTYMSATRRLLCSLASRAQRGRACQRRRRQCCSSPALPVGTATAIPAAGASFATPPAGSARLAAGGAPLLPQQGVRDRPAGRVPARGLPDPLGALRRGVMTN
jgi:hypothetical protein